MNKLGELAIKILGELIIKIIETMRRIKKYTQLWTK